MKSPTPTASPQILGKPATSKPLQIQTIPGCRPNLRFCILLVMLAAFSSSAGTWKNVKVDNGKMTVDYCISELSSEDGKKVPLIEYRALTREKVSFQSCVAVLKDVAHHKSFTGDEVSKQIGVITANEWIVYYYTKMPWPFEDNDCVARMTIAEDHQKKTASFTLTAAPALYQTAGVPRMTLYDITYTFKDCGNGMVEACVTSKVTPPIKVPLTIIKAAFPKAGTDCLHALLERAKNGSEQGN